MDRTVQLSGEAAIALTGTATASSRTSLSIVHLLSAAQFARATGEIEKRHEGQPLGDFWDDLYAQSIATVLTTVAGIEAYANELFVDHAQVFPDLRVDVMAKLWELYEQKPTREKFEFALLLRQGGPFDRGAAPFQDVAALIRLRNALTHYKPEWSDQLDEHAKLSKSLEHRASPSPFLPLTESLFPRAWASHGSTTWAMRSAVAFLSDFERRAKLDSRIASFGNRLSAL